MKKTLIFFCALFLTLSLILGYTTRRYQDKSKHPFKIKFPLSETLFQEKLLKSPPSWVKEQIEKDLSFYKQEKIQKKDLDRIFQGSMIEELNLVRFTIQSNKISFSLSEKNLDFRPFRNLLASLKKLSEMTSLPDVDFIISLHDSLDEDLHAPIFVYAKPKYISSLILMPDFKALTGYPGLKKEIEKANRTWSWEKKINKAFWRGSSTGNWLTALQWMDLPRMRLCLLSQLYPKMLDAKITAVVQADPEVPSFVKKKDLLGKKKSQKEHLEYKYLVDVDGNSCSFERYFWALLSHSVVLKQITPNVQWYYLGLKPYEHFIPVKEDLSDLMDQIQWAKENDSKAKQIALASTHFIQEELSLEDTFVYMAHLLQGYARCQSF